MLNTQHIHEPLKYIDIDTVNLANVIITFWDNYLNFKQLPNVWETVVIPHNTNDIENIMPETECYVFEYWSAGRLISVGGKYQTGLQNFFKEEWYSFDGLKTYFESVIQKNTRIFWPVCSLYLFSTEKLLPKDSRVCPIWNKDRKIYDDFIESCMDSEMKEVNMEFKDPNHRFFILTQNGFTVSLGNYSIEKQTWIAHIGIVTPKKYQWNGYGKALVNTIVHDILDNNLTPQYRADTTNLASMNIAESLGFTKVLESYSFVV